MLGSFVRRLLRKFVHKRYNLDLDSSGRPLFLRVVKPKDGIPPVREILLSQGFNDRDSIRCISLPDYIRIVAIGAREPSGVLMGIVHHSYDDGFMKRMAEVPSQSVSTTCLKGHRTGSLLAIMKDAAFRHLLSAAERRHRAHLDPLTAAVHATS